MMPYTGKPVSRCTTPKITILIVVTNVEIITLFVELNHIVLPESLTDSIFIISYNFMIWLPSDQILNDDTFIRLQNELYTRTETDI